MPFQGAYSCIFFLTYKMENNILDNQIPGRNQYPELCRLFKKVEYALWILAGSFVLILFLQIGYAFGLDLPIDYIALVFQSVTSLLFGSLFIKAALHLRKFRFNPQNESLKRFSYTLATTYLIKYMLVLLVIVLIIGLVIKGYLKI